MTDFIDFFAKLGFPAGVAVASLWIMYRIGSRLVEKHISTLSVIEQTQKDMHDALTRILGLIDSIHDRIKRDG